MERIGGARQSGLAVAELRRTSRTTPPSPPSSPISPLSLSPQVSRAPLPWSPVVISNNGDGSPQPGARGLIVAPPNLQTRPATRLRAARRHSGAAVLLASLVLETRRVWSRWVAARGGSGAQDRAAGKGRGLLEAGPRRRRNRRRR